MYDYYYYYYYCEDGVGDRKVIRMGMWMKLWGWGGDGASLFYHITVY